MRRMISLENENPRGSQTFTNAAAMGSTPLQAQVRQSMKNYKEDIVGSVTPGSSTKKDLVLPDIVTPSTIQPLSSTTNTSHNIKYGAGAT